MLFGGADEGLAAEVVFNIVVVIILEIVSTLLLARWRKTRLFWVAISVLVGIGGGLSLGFK